MVLQDLLYFTVAEGINLEKNRTTLNILQRAGNLKRYQVWNDKHGKVFTQIYDEIDPAVTEFIRLSE